MYCEASTSLPIQAADITMTRCLELFFFACIASVYSLNLDSTTVWAQTELESSHKAAPIKQDIEIWLTGSSRVVINREIIQYNDLNDLRATLAKKLQSLETLKINLVTNCATSADFIRQIESLLSDTDREFDYEIQTRCTPASNGDKTRQEIVFHSDIIDQDFTLSVIFPENYSSNKTYPLAIFTDANLNYASNNENQSMTNVLQDISLSLLANKAAPELILLGIGYPTYTANYRERDLIPEPNYSAGRSNINFGGADKFANFIEFEVKPFIYSKAKIDRDRETYLGHSYGGLFGVYMLFNNPDLFDNYILSSPSLWYNAQGQQDGISFIYEDRFAAMNNDLSKSVYISAGTREGGSMPEDAKIMHERLQARNYKSLRLQLGLFEGKNHHTVVIPAYTEGLSFVFNN